jgi:threonine/homoserine/homoserine lactone efflux protein
MILTKAKRSNELVMQDKVALRKVYSQGVLTNLLNPKVALFYLSFLPQFISPNNVYGVLPFILLGFTFITTGTIWCLMLVVYSHRMARKIKESWLSRYLDKITGVIFIALGINLMRQTRD